MKIKKRTMVNPKWCLVLLAAWLAWPADAAYVIMNDGRRIDGTAIRARADGTVILTMERGTQEFPRGQYREAWAARPPQLDEARRHMQREEWDRVISSLDGVVQRYRHLSWDVEALALIARAKNAQGEYDDALASFDQLFRIAPQRREDSSIRWPYYAALLGAGQHSRLETQLNELISDGSRDDAARAQVMRGDLNRSRGRTQEGLLDYLRTVVLFRAQSEVQAEALFKAGLALEEMRDQRARDMFRRVVEEHGRSPFAQQARAKL